MEIFDAEAVAFWAYFPRAARFRRFRGLRAQIFRERCRKKLGSVYPYLPLSEGCLFYVEVPTDAFGRGRVHQNPLSLSHPISVVWLARVSSVCLGGVPRVGRRRDFEARVLYCGASESRTWGVGLHSGGQPHGAFGRDPGRLKSDVTRAPPPPVLAGPVGGTCGAPPLRVDGSVTLLPPGLPRHQPEGVWWRAGAPFRTPGCVCVCVCVCRLVAHAGYGVRGLGPALRIASPAAAGGSPCGCPLYISGPGHPAGTLATGGAHHGPPLEAWLRVESGS